MSRNTNWWDVKATPIDSGEVHQTLVQYVQEVERVHSSHFDRFVKLAFLYDPNDERCVDDWDGPRAQVQNNVVSTNVDTVHAIVAATEVGIRFSTKDGDWSAQRSAKHREWYSENLCKSLDVDEKCADAFKDGALKGTGIIKVCADQFDRVVVERVMVDDIIVDNEEARNGKPKQMHQRKLVDREELIAAYPEKEDQIESAQTTGNTDWRYWAGYRPLQKSEVVCIESWKLPVGVKGKPGYKPGRHVITIDGCDLFDEAYEDDYFPFAVFRWSKRNSGWYGLSLAERIAGHQRAINKLNWQIDRQLDQMAAPTTYVRLADKNLAVQTTNRVGTIAVVKGDIPTTVIPKAVSPETYGREEVLDRQSSAVSGVSKLSSGGLKPGGLDSGAALREYRDSTTQRFAPQEKAYERLKKDVVWLILAVCKKLGDDAPVMLKKTKWGSKKIKWADVDMVETRYQLAVASNMSKTPAGRLQLALEWAQAGVISQDEARSLMEHPDTEHSISLYTAADKNIEMCIESILDGELLMPEPYQNLKMGIWKFQQSYLKAWNDGAPEEILEGLRQWIVQAGFILSPPQLPELPAGPESMDPGLAPEAQMGAPPPSQMPEMGAAMQGSGVTPMDLTQ